MKKLLAFIPAAILLSFFIIPSCQKEVSKETGNDSLFVAGGSLKDSNNICLKDSVHGTFYNGVTPGGDTAYLEVQVNVTNTGSYTISTDQQNGFLFSATGFFTSTGINTVLLKPIGTPILQKLTDFAISFDSTVCLVSVDVKDSTGSGAGGIDTTGGGGTDTTTTGLNTWKFTASDTSNLSGDATAVFTTTVFNSLQISGFTSILDTVMFIIINFPTAAITPGNYITSNANVFSLSSLTNGPIYKADASTGAALDVVNLVISSYDPITKIVTGTFSGSAQDILGNSVPITKGAFKAVVN